MTDLPRKPDAQWRMDPADVKAGTTAVSRDDRQRRHRSRRTDRRELTLCLEHLPTGIRLEGSVPSGHYSRDEMRWMKDALHARLWGELELRVARHLGVPGR